MATTWEDLASTTSTANVPTPTPSTDPWAKLAAGLPKPAAAPAPTAGSSSNPWAELARRALPAATPAPASTQPLAAQASASPSPAPPPLAAQTAKLAGKIGAPPSTWQGPADVRFEQQMARATKQEQERADLERMIQNQQRYGGMPPEAAPIASSTLLPPAMPRPTPPTAQERAEEYATALIRQGVPDERVNQLAAEEIARQERRQGAPLSAAQRESITSGVLQAYGRRGPAGPLTPTEAEQGRIVGEQGSDVGNIAVGFMQAPVSAIRGATGLVSSTAGRRIGEAMELVQAPDTLATAAGRVLGGAALFSPAMAGTIPATATIGAGALSAAGEQRIQAAERRAAGEQVSGLEEAGRATGAAALDLLSQLVTLGVLKHVGGAVAKEVPGLVKAVASRDAASASKVLGRMLAKGGTEATAGGYGPAFATSLARQLTGLEPTDPQQGMIAQANRAGLEGAATVTALMPVSAAIQRGPAKARERQIAAEETRIDAYDEQLTKQANLQPSNVPPSAPDPWKALQASMERQRQAEAAHEQAQLEQENRAVEQRQQARAERGAALQAHPADAAALEAQRYQAELAREQQEYVRENAAAERRARAMEYTPQQVQAASIGRLRVLARDLGVPFDTRSTTIPRIIDAQERGRILALSDKELWDRVRALGLRAGNRQQNIETLINVSRYGLPEPQQPAQPAQEAPGAAIAPETTPNPAEPATRAQSAAEAGTRPAPAPRHRYSTIPPEWIGRTLYDWTGGQLVGKKGQSLPLGPGRRGRNLGAVYGNQLEDIAPQARSLLKEVRGLTDEIWEVQGRFRRFVAPKEVVAEARRALEQRGVDVAGEVEAAKQARAQRAAQRQAEQASRSRRIVGIADELVRTFVLDSGRYERGAGAEPADPRRQGTVGQAMTWAKQQPADSHAYALAYLFEKARRDPRGTQYEWVEPSTLVDGTEIQGPGGERLHVEEDPDTGAKVVKDGITFPAREGMAIPAKGVSEGNGGGDVPQDFLAGIGEVPARAETKPQPAPVETQPKPEAAPSPRYPLPTIAEASMQDLRRAAAFYGIDPQATRMHLVEQLQQIEHAARREGTLARDASLLDLVPADVEMPRPAEAAKAEERPPAAAEEQPRQSLPEGYRAAGGGVGLFGQPTFESPVGGQERFGFGEVDQAAKRERAKTYSPEIERKPAELPPTEKISASAEAVNPENTSPMFPAETQSAGTTEQAIAQWKQREQDRAGGAGWDLSVIDNADRRYRAIAKWLEKHPWTPIERMPEALKSWARQMAQQGMLDRLWDSSGLPHYATKGTEPRAGLLTEAQIDAMEKPRTGGGSLADRADEGQQSPAVFEPKPATAKLPGRTITLRPIEMPELVRLARELLSEPPEVKKLRTARGLFRPQGQGSIAIDVGTAKDPYQLARTLAHEIGHGVDYLDDLVMQRGNLLARVKSLVPIANGLGRLKGFLRDSFGDGGPTNKELRKELLDLSGWWRPGDMNSAYRRSSVELYADALSVLLNSPGELQQRAPRFFAELIRHLDKKPDVFKAYMDLQDTLAGTPENLAKLRRQDIREAFTATEDAIRARAVERQALDTSLTAVVRQGLYDSARPITDMTQSVVREHGRTPGNLAAQYALDELGYANNGNHLMLRRMEREVVEPAKAAGLSLDDLGEFLMMHRIRTERAEIANPFGHTPQTAEAQIADLRETLGPKKFGALEDAVRRFHEIVFESVQRAVDVGTYNREQFDSTIEPNKYNYAAFGVLDYVQDRVPAGIRKQIGTFKAIGNPFTITVMKTISLNRLNELQTAKNQVRDWIKQHFEGDIQGPYPIDEHHTPPAPGPNREHLIILQDGKPVAYEVDQYVAKMFLHHDIGLLRRLAKFVGFWTYLRHPLYITGSPGFQVSNLFRDLKRTWVNLGSLQGTSIRDVLKAYWQAKGPAWRRARGVDDALIERMLQEKALDTPFARYHIDGDGESTAYQRLLEQYGLAEPSTARKAYLNTLGRIWRGAEIVGTFIETVPKAAGFQMLEAKGVPARERSYNVRNYVGTPNLRRRGLATDISNSVFMYSNAFLQGARADAELALYRPGTRAGWAMRRLAIDVMPKLMQKAALAGLFGAGIKVLMQNIPSYDLANYTVIPLGATGDGDEKKTVYLRIPHDETGRLGGSILWALLDAKDSGLWKGLQNAISYGCGGLPGWSPPLREAYNWASYLAGENPTDFRGRPIISEDDYKAGGPWAAKDMLRWQFDQLGVISELGRGFISRPDGTRQRTTTEVTLNSIPGLSRLLKVSDRGISEDQWDEVAVKDAEAARFRLGLPDEVRALVRERYRLSRLDLAGLGPPNLRRLGVLDDFYSRYLNLTEQIKAAEATRDDATAKRLRGDLDAAAREYRGLVRPSTPEQRERAAEMTRSRILGSEKLTPEQQDEALRKAGIEPPADLPITRELHALRRRQRAAQEAEGQWTDLMRRASAAGRAGDAARAREFKQRGLEMRRVAKGNLSRAEELRLGQLEAAAEYIKLQRQRVEDGRLTAEVAERLIRARVQRVMSEKKEAA